MAHTESARTTKTRVLMALRRQPDTDAGVAARLLLSDRQITRAMRALRNSSAICAAGEKGDSTVWKVAITPMTVRHDSTAAVGEVASYRPSTVLANPPPGWGLSAS